MSLLNAIDSAVGIQHQGITDKSGSDTVLRLTNGLIIGDFGRGRFDQPMFITKDTLSQLGDESRPAYQTVADCLDTGVPSVWVMRVPSPSAGELDCSPSVLSIPQTVIPNATVRIYYSVDNDPVVFWEYDLEGFDMDYLFGSFFASLGFVVSGGGGLGHFQFISQFTPSQVSGAGASSVEELNPRTLTLHLAPPENTAVDVIELVFGTSVSVHSCAVVNFLGI